MEIGVDSVALTSCSQLDFGTARLRLPASDWAAWDIPYHRPVRVTLEASEGPWSIYCISAFARPDEEAPPNCSPACPLPRRIDARVVLPPSVVNSSADPAASPCLCPPLSRLHSAWQEAAVAGTCFKLQHIASPIQNARAVKLAAPEPLLPFIQRIRVKLHQTLVVQGCYIQLGAGGDAQAIQVVGIELLAAAEPPTPPSHSKKQPKQAKQQQQLQQQQQAAPPRGLPLCRITATTQLEVVSQQHYWQQQQQQQQQQQEEFVHKPASAPVDQAGHTDARDSTSANGVVPRKEESSSCSSPAASVGLEGGADSALRKGSKSGAGGLKKKAPEGGKKKRKKKVKEEREEGEEEGEQAAGHLASKFDILHLMDEDA